MKKRGELIEEIPASYQDILEGWSNEDVPYAEEQAFGDMKEVDESWSDELRRIQDWKEIETCASCNTTIRESQMEQHSVRR